MANEITNSVSNTLISGTKNNDQIYNSAHHVTINAGKGDDVIEFSKGSSRSVYQYASGDGDDTISGFENFVEGSIVLTSGSISKYTIDPIGDHILKIDTGSITIKNLSVDSKVAVTMNKKKLSLY